MTRLPLIGPETNATIIPGSPARATRLALWEWDHDATDGEAVDLVLPSSDGVELRSVIAHSVSVAEVLDELIAVGPTSASTPSVRAWSVVVRAALALVSRGRLKPAIAADGSDQWAIGPLNERDRSLRSHLVEHLPASAHCVAVDDSLPLRILSQEAAVVACYQAIADSMPRTPAAAMLFGQREWAASDVSDVARLRPLLSGSDSAERTIVGLRLQVPDFDDGMFRCELQLRSAVDPSRVIDAADLWGGESASFDHQAETDLLLAIRRGATVWPPLRRLLDFAEPSSMDLSDVEAMELFGNAAVDLGGAGIEVLVPTALTKTLTASAHAEPPAGVDAGPGWFDLQSMCQLTWRATIDGEVLSEAQLEVLARSNRPMVKVADEWVVVDPAVLAKLARRELLSSADALAAALGGQILVDDELVDVEVGGSIADLADRLRSATDPEPFDDPAELHAELRPYQRRGVAWIEQMSALGFGGVLADDMGLGKTIQVIALLLHRAEVSSTPGAPTLVVCPASVVTNWVREIERFAPSIVAHRYTGPDRDLGAVRPGEVVITSYGLARRDVNDLSRISWGLVVADEAQHIKNPNSSTARAMRRVPSAARLALTGTPVENRLTELWALLDWTTPGLLGTVESFRRRISIPIERDRDPDVTERFGRMIAPFLMRRRKDDPAIVPELPPKTETDHEVTLTPEQAALYQAVVDDVLAKVSHTDGIARRGLVLKLLTELKQVCNHPAHFLGQPGPLVDRSGKLDAFEELVTAITDAGDSMLVFTQYVVMGNLLIQRLGELGIGAEFLHGSLSITRRTEMVDRFQAGEFPVFVISLKAGGTGLNLTQATHVVHYDRWWNPAVENQASDRAWRIGQTRPVQIHRLNSAGTLEERIAAVLDHKRTLADSVIGSGETWISELNDAELTELVELSSDSL